eukprot:3163948-Pyramimonas_sp.AAC.1
MEITRLLTAPSVAASVDCGSTEARGLWKPEEARGRSMRRLRAMPRPTQSSSPWTRVRTILSGPKYRNFTFPSDPPVRPIT